MRFPHDAPSHLRKKTKKQNPQTHKGWILKSKKHHASQVALIPQMQHFCHWFLCEALWDTVFSAASCLFPPHPIYSPQKNKTKKQTKTHAFSKTRFQSSTFYFFGKKLFLFSIRTYHGPGSCIPCSGKNFHWLQQNFHPRKSAGSVPRRVDSYLVYAALLMPKAKEEGKNSNSHLESGKSSSPGSM